MTHLPLEIWILLSGLGLVACFVWSMLTEWSYLDRRLVRRSYDWLAPWYEGKWQSGEYQSEKLNRELFLAPLLKVVANQPQARVLDLACGTGRVSRLLLAEPRFQGRLVGMDFSQRMLEKFRQHLSLASEVQRNRVHLIQQDVQQWTCDRPQTFDAVLLLEAAELIPQLPRLMEQIATALKPGGVLVTTQVGKKFAWLFAGRHQKGDAMTKLLCDHGFEIVRMSAWRKRYDVVLARRTGNKS